MNKTPLQPLRKGLLASLALGLLSLPAITGHSATILFDQDFSSSTTVGDYQGTGSNQFDVLGSTGAAGNFSESITSDDLVLSTLASPAGGTAGEGFRRTTSYLGGFSALRVEFTLSLNNNVGSNGTFAIFEMGAGLQSSFTATTSVTNRWVKLNFSKGSSNNINVVNDAASDTTFNLGTGTLSGTTISYQLIVNDTGSSITYAAPGALGDLTIDNGNMALFFDSGSGWSSAFSNIAAENGSTGDLTQFRFARQRVDANTAAIFDTFRISSLDAIPEPSSAALIASVGMLSLAVTRRRIRR